MWFCCVSLNLLILLFCLADASLVIQVFDHLISENRERLLASEKLIFPFDNKNLWFTILTPSSRSTMSSPRYTQGFIQPDVTTVTNRFPVYLYNLPIFIKNFCFTGIELSICDFPRSNVKIDVPDPIRCSRALHIVYKMSRNHSDIA